MSLVRGDPDFPLDETWVVNDVTLVREYDTARRGPFPPPPSRSLRLCVPPPLASPIACPGTSPWKKTGNVNSWRKWLHLDSGEPLPESAVTAFRTVQANWAEPSKIAGERGL